MTARLNPSASEGGGEICQGCDRRLLPGSKCPFCKPQRFGDGVATEETQQIGLQQRVGHEDARGVFAARAAATEHGARGFLHVFRGTSRGATVLLGEKPLLVGRRADANVLALSDVGVSGKHFEIRPAAEGFEIVDLGSKNGTFVHHKRVERKPLTNGDIIEIGHAGMYVGLL